MLQSNILEYITFFLFNWGEKAINILSLKVTYSFDQYFEWKPVNLISLP